MASDRQVEANRRNSLKSTGPKSAEGKARVARNALVHGLAGESAEVGPGWSAEFSARRAAWADEIRPRSVEADQALDAVVAATIRMEACGTALDVLAAKQVARARLGWDDDRRVEAADLFAGIAAAPLVVSARLASTRHGADLLIETWTLLGVAIDTVGDWSPSEASTALDLLGVPAGFRDGRTALDPPAGVDRPAWLRSIARREIARLRDRRAESLDELDALDRRCAEIEATVVLTKPAALVLRYERDAWRRFQTSLRAAKAPAPSSDGPDRGAEFVREADEPRHAAETPAASYPDVRAAAFADRAGPDEEDDAKASSSAWSPFPASLPLAASKCEPERVDAPPHLNRHQRRALRASERCG